MDSIRPDVKLPNCHEIPADYPDFAHATDLLEPHLQQRGTPACISSSYAAPQKTQNSHRPLAFLGSLIFGMGGCGGDSLDISSSSEIQSLSPATDEIALTGPLLGKVRGVSFAEAGTEVLLGAFSVTDFDNPDAHGTFGVHIEGINHYLFPDKLSSDTSVPRETHVAALDNTTSVTLVRRVSDAEQPGQLVAQLYTAEGNRLGEEIEVANTFGAGAKVVPFSDGFGVLYLSDLDGQLKLRRYDFSGNFEDESDLGLTLPPKATTVSRGENGAWVLAALQGQNVEVLSFVDGEPGEIHQRVGSGALTQDARISVNMAPDGSVMVAWNAIKENNTPFLQGIFVAPDGARYNQEGFDLEELTRSLDGDGNVFINEHAIASDGEGNFILSFEQGGNIHALSFVKGLGGFNTEDPQRFVGLTSSMSPVAQGESFQDFLMGLSNPSTNRSNLNTVVSGGQLYLGHRVALSGTDEFGDTDTVAAIAFRAFEITYQD